VPVAGLAAPVFEESWLLGRRVRAGQGHAYVLSPVGYVHRLARKLPSALAATGPAVRAVGPIEHAAGQPPPRQHLASLQPDGLARDAGKFDAAGERLREALRLRRRLGDRRGEKLSLANLGLLAAAAGDVAEGRRLARTALDRGEAVDDGPGVAGALLNRAVVE